MYYRLVFTKNSRLRSILKILLLIAGLFCDFSVVWGLVFVCLGAYYYFFMLFGSLAFSILFRVVALRLVYNIEYKLQSGNLVISKIYPNKTQVILSEKLCDLNVEPYSKSDLNTDVQDSKNLIDLAVSEYEQYLVKGKSKSVICNLDKYIYASILKGEEI